MKLVHNSIEFLMLFDAQTSDSTMLPATYVITHHDIVSVGNSRHLNSIALLTRS